MYIYIYLPIAKKKKKICIPAEVYKEDQTNIIVVIIFTRRHNDLSFIQYLRKTNYQHNNALFFTTPVILKHVYINT